MTTDKNNEPEEIDITKTPEWKDSGALSWMNPIDILAQIVLAHSRKDVVLFFVQLGIATVAIETAVILIVGDARPSLTGNFALDIVANITCCLIAAPLSGWIMYEILKTFHRPTHL
ncbi:hypothetical protein FACS1894189_2250 [Planctomycetales bacterium]|nr:hypothetical protein FACS1894189_2250 [Planctomycetales bacterium]